MKEIKINLDKIECIAHIADIHIRMLNRHQEYREVFEKLYEDLRQLPENTLIYVGGDIIHSKTNLTPELVSLASSFLLNLSKIRPTVVIAGNHDVNLKNKSRLDSITPIIDIIREDNEIESNLIYLKNTGLYKIANCLFSVMSVFSKADDYNILEDFIKPNGIDYTIALFHGVVNGAITDTGHVLETESVNKSTFRNFDFSLLGDIHMFQYMNSKKTIAYPGSLICQNHGESNDKGYLIWNLPVKESIFRNITNDYGYYTIEIESGKILTDLNSISSKPYLRIISKNTSKLELDECINKLKEEFDIKELVVKADRFVKEDSKKITNFNLENFYDEKYRLDIIKKYIKEFYPNTSINQNILEEINERLSKQLYKKDIVSYRWKPISFEFSNMFSYGENNKIDFSNISGIFGLFGKNYSGKSSIIEALIYCIFDKCPKTGKAIQVLNSNKKEFSCEFKFELNNEIYTIKKVGKRKDNSVKVDIDFYKEDQTGNIISLNGEQRHSSNTSIRGYLGEYDDFILTTISSQSRTPEFADKTQGERKAILSSFLNLDVFEFLYELSNEELKDIKNRIKFFDIQGILSNKEEYSKSLEEAEKFLLDVESKKDELNGRISFLKKEIDKLKNTIINVEIKDTIEGIDKEENSVKEIIKNYRKQIEDLEKKKEGSTDSITKEKKNINDIILLISTEEKVIENFDKEKEIINQKLEEIDINSINKTLLEFDKIKKKIELIESEIRILESTIKIKNISISSLSNYSYNKDCNYCIENIDKFTGGALKAKDELPLLEKDLIGKNNELEFLNTRYNDRVLFENTLKEHASFLDNKRNIELSVGISSNTIQSLNNKIESSKNNIEWNTQVISTSKESILFLETAISVQDSALLKIFNRRKELLKMQEVLENNKKIKDEISSLDKTILNNTNELHEVIQMSGRVKNKIEELIANIEKSKDKIKEFKEIEETNVALDLYVKSVHKNGLPLKIINDILPVIEDSVNSSLSYITDFSIRLENEDNNINGYIVRSGIDEYSFELASGFERTIISMAFRVAMIEISNLSKAAFLVYDEGFGTMDYENLLKLRLFFELLKMKFDFVIIITHIDSIKDIVDNYYEVERNNEYSFIDI